MLGHNPVVLNRLTNIRNTLNSAMNTIESDRKNPQSDFSILKILLQDAIGMVEQLSPTKNALVEIATEMRL